MKSTGAGFLIAILVAAVCACSSQAGGPGRPQSIGISKPEAPLVAAIKHSVRLGPTGPDTTVHLSFGLKVRNQTALDALIASGHTVSPDEFAARFGPDPILVSRVVSTLDAAGLSASWPGSELITADGPAPQAAALLSVDLENYRLGTREFYATLDQPRLPETLAAVVTGVSGLDNYRHARSYAIHPGGLTPADVLAYYDIKALRDAGLDGTSQTILFPEIDDLPNLKDLDKFASEFGLPAFDSLVTIKRNPSWGTPDKPQGETALDLEIAHSVAPNAKLVVYMSASDFGHSDRAFDQLVTDHLGSIISESLGSCETDTPNGARNNYAGIQDRATAQGMTHFVASGDNGAFTCGEDQPPAASFPSTLPTVTAVGGTSVFESQQGIYYKEWAWGSPIDQSGGGGGASTFYPAPGYQRNETQAAGHGFRQVPDISADADPSTGFHVVFDGQDAQVGGTSAATPLWAATAALINQDLKKKSLREIGFANAAIYWMGENSSKLNPKPFHDVTSGNNLGFDAAAGWDFATGWGSMDAAALDSAWALYIKSGGS